MKFEFSPSELERIEQNHWLTDRERTVFDLYYRRGWKIEDIAAEIDVSRRTITTIKKSICKKALTIL